ncbi:UNVERIFIED_CONTAM: hypothetical protein K2H54_061329, partial [Gekko kuhli]
MIQERPSQPTIEDRATFLETEQLKMLGECISNEGYPEGNLTWYRNGMVLKHIEGAVVINEQTDVDKASGLYTMISSLEYMPTREDKNAYFTCTMTYYGPTGRETIRSESVNFDVH